MNTKINISLKIGIIGCIFNLILFSSITFRLFHRIRINTHTWLESIHITLLESHNLKEREIKTINGENFLISVGKLFHYHNFPLTPNIESILYTPSRIALATKVPKYYCNSNYLIGYHMGYLPQIHGRSKPYYMLYSTKFNERIMQYGAYVAWHVVVCYCQQHICYLYTCIFSVKWAHQVIEWYYTN